MVGGVDFNDIKCRMDGVVMVFKSDIVLFCIGCVFVNFFDMVMVEVYGLCVLLNQVVNIIVFELCMLGVLIWDKQMVGVVDCGICEFNFGFNLIVDGQNLCILLLEFNEECCKLLVKFVYEYVEKGKVVVCYVCCDGMDVLKKVEKDGDIGQDESCMFFDKIQKMIDDMIVEIDKVLVEKEKEIMQV